MGLELLDLCSVLITENTTKDNSCLLLSIATEKVPTKTVTIDTLSIVQAL